MTVQLSLESLLKPLSPDDVEFTAYSVLTKLGFPTSSWKPNGIARRLISLVAQLVAPFTQTGALVTGSGFLDIATGDWLTLFAKQFFDVTRQEATFAPGFVTLNNAAGGVYSYTAGTFYVVNPTTRKVFVNTSAFTLGALQTGLVVPIQAVEAGSASSSLAGAISSLQTTLVGVTCSNASPLLARDQEGDDALRVRCRAKLGSLSPNGHVGAYNYVLLTSDVNGGVVVTRVSVTPDSNTGLITIYVANDTGGCRSSRASSSRSPSVGSSSLRPAASSSGKRSSAR